MSNNLLKRLVSRTTLLIVYLIASLLMSSGLSQVQLVQQTTHFSINTDSGVTHYDSSRLSNRPKRLFRHHELILELSDGSKMSARLFRLEAEARYYLIDAFGDEVSDLLLEDIVAISVERKSMAGEGLVAAGVTGAVIGVMYGRQEAIAENKRVEKSDALIKIKSDVDGYAALYGCLLGGAMGIVGGILGASAGNDTRHDCKDFSLFEKQGLLMRLAADIPRK